MKRVLVVQYSQTGQLARIAKRLLSPWAGAGPGRLAGEGRGPRRRFPSPGSLWRFFDVRRESVLLAPPALEPLSVRPDEQFDLVVLAYQVWFLAPSGPITAFLKS